MKVVHISTYVSNGGAAIAAFRLHQGMMKRPDVESSMLQKFAEDRGFMAQNNIYLAEKDKAFIARIRRKFNIDQVTLQNKRIEKLERKYEIASIPFSSYRIEEHPIVKDADIIHLHWVADDFLNYPTFFKSVKQPIVWTLHDMNPFQGLFHYKEDEIKNKEKLGVIDKNILETKMSSIHKKQDIHIVTLSSWMKEFSENSLTFHPYPHYLIPNGLDFSKYSRLDRAELKEKNGLNNGLKTLLFVSADIENYRKGFDLLIPAINQQQISFNLVTVGGKKIPVDKSINHIHFEKIINTTELNKIYTASDLTILPSREDNLPNVMLESFANGTPILSFNNGGMAEHIKNGKNGILIEEISTEALAKGISDFLNDKYQFDSDRIREYAIEKFSDVRQTEEYVRLYNSILK